MRLPATPIELTFPGQSRWMRSVRLTASGVGVACGLPLDENEDFRLLVDEVCGALIEACDAAAPVHIAFRITPSAIVVEGSTRTDRRREPDDARRALGRQILDVLADSHHLTQDGDRLTLVASYGVHSQGVG
jgi:hypothetical protein